ncbi:hypothetical protein DVU_1476 [Nitratidesulfovibrio vulgaris str. Hildenborough]|uniref:Uncharacterized protein n=1 Tax=Nitratidesulfovibrio vulgaris (strain ATCC 29579 / DSM 644 / CCUG 34227 / NCIMB 8303 / VKM B-1760 / Hildenborough) TaxID=882 RepID=Q72C08_NITV2|nr:hypothetical protein DVU_1476 [Nitratidesulfovibrio vulgaris str. Hildenborough]
MALQKEVAMLYSVGIAMRLQRVINHQQGDRHSHKHEGYRSHHPYGATLGATTKIQNIKIKLKQTTINHV